MMLLRPVVAFAVAFLVATPASSHCDGLDGPVVAAAQKALALSDASAVLIWVKPRDEAEVRHAFDEALGVRKLGPQARQMADRYFYETLVRLHRAGEGAPYTGLKPAGRDLGPAIPLADKAVSSDSDQQIASFLAGEAAEAIHEKFADPQRKRKFQADDLAAGREYVASYVAFVHYVEALHQATQAGADAEASESPHRE
jgi:hypothetical protein